MSLAAAEEGPRAVKLDIHQPMRPCSRGRPRFPPV
jgi:hypothetical protein